MKLHRALSVICLYAVFVSAPAEANWWHDHHNRNETRNVSGQGNITGTGSAIPGVLWRAPQSGLIVEAPTRLVDLDGDQTPELLSVSHGRVHAFNANGTIKWTTVAVGAAAVTHEADRLRSTREGHDRRHDPRRQRRQVGGR